MDMTLQQCGLKVAPMILQLAHESIREGFTNKILEDRDIYEDFPS